MLVTVQRVREFAMRGMMRRRLARVVQRLKGVRPSGRLFAHVTFRVALIRRFSFRHLASFSFLLVVCFRLH